MIAIIIERQPFNYSNNIYIVQKEGNRVTSVAKVLEMETRKMGKVYPPTFEITDEEAQCFMDELWRVGFRPTEGTGSAGSLAATEKHLNDMRNIVLTYFMPTITCQQKNKEN